MYSYNLRSGLLCPLYTWFFFIDVLNNSHFTFNAYTVKCMAKILLAPSFICDASVYMQNIQLSRVTCEQG